MSRGQLYTADSSLSSKLVSSVVEDWKKVHIRARIGHMYLAGVLSHVERKEQ
jgi:hypothetical protein